MKKVLILFISLFALLSCSKDTEDPATKELEINFENLRGKWVFLTKINGDGSTQPCVFDCAANPDYALMTLKAYNEIEVIIANRNCEIYFYSNCDRYFFDGNRIKNANNSSFFEDARITSLTATTLKIEYDQVRNFGAGLNEYAKGFIFKKQ